MRDEVELVYETHSTTVDNERGIATGWLPGELSEAGKQQARRLGERRRGDGFAVVYTSDLRRAVQTAELAFEGVDISIRADPRLRECDYGELNGASAERVAAERARRVDEPFLGGESYRGVVARTRPFLVDVLARHRGERVLLIAHSANRWALEHLLHGRPLEELVAEPFAWRPGWRYVVRANALSSSAGIE